MKPFKRKHFSSFDCSSILDAAAAGAHLLHMIHPYLQLLLGVAAEQPVVARLRLLLLHGLYGLHGRVHLLRAGGHPLALYDELVLSGYEGDLEPHHRLAGGERPPDGDGAGERTGHGGSAPAGTRPSSTPRPPPPR